MPLKALINHLISRIIALKSSKGYEAATLLPHILQGQE
jgi:hypothetical protein